MTRAASVLTVALVGFLAGTLGYLAGGGFRLVAPASPPGFGGSPPSFATVVSRVSPAVVHVDVIEDGRSGPDFGEVGLGLPRRGEGSGFIVDPDGYILTNHHLVPGSARVRVRLADRRELAARRVGSDPSTDLALLKVEARGLPALPLGDSDRLRVGDWVCAIGNPLEFDNTVTVGVVSSKGRKIFNPSFDSYIQTDAAINPGSSGGPLVNLRGEAIGISAAVSSEAQGIGFAIPSNVARAILTQLREGRVRRGYLGVELHELDPDLAGMMGLGEWRGALVVDVAPEGAAKRAGLRRWDVITAVDGSPIDDGDELVRTISSLRPGTDVRLSLLRDGRELTVSAHLGERTIDSGPEPERVRPTAGPPEGGDVFGFVVADLDAQSRAALAVPHDKVGVVIQSILGADPGTDLLEEGDLVVEINRRSTPDVRAYEQVVHSLPAGRSAWLYVYRPDPPGAFLTRLQVAGRR
jgi:serine protease Do